MSDLQFLDSYSFIEEVGADTANTDLLAVAPSATANVKGSIVEMVASTAEDCDLISVCLQGDNQREDFVYDLLVGGVASEELIAEDLRVRTFTAVGSAKYDLKIDIPSGSRLSVRCASSASGASDGKINAQLFSGTFESDSPGSYIKAYNVSFSRGVDVDPGGTANTKGSWTELVASTSNDHKGLIISIGTSDNSGLVEADYMYDIGIGTVSSEQIIKGNVFFSVDSFEALSDRVFYINQAIPSGTRIVARAQSSITDATDRVMDLIVYGVD